MASTTNKPFEYFLESGKETHQSIPEQQKFRIGEVWRVHDCFPSLFQDQNHPRAIFIRENQHPAAPVYEPLYVWVVSSKPVIRRVKDYIIPLVQVYPLDTWGTYSLPVVRVPIYWRNLYALPTLVLEVRIECLDEPLIQIKPSSGTKDLILAQLLDARLHFEQYQDGKREKPNDSFIEISDFKNESDRLQNDRWDYMNQQLNYLRYARQEVNDFLMYHVFNE